MSFDGIPPFHISRNYPICAHASCNHSDATPSGRPCTHTASPDGTWVKFGLYPCRLMHPVHLHHSVALYDRRLGLTLAIDSLHPECDRSSKLLMHSNPFPPHTLLVLDLHRPMMLRAPCIDRDNTTPPDYGPGCWSIWCALAPSCTDGSKFNFAEPRQGMFLSFDLQFSSSAILDVAPLRAQSACTSCCVVNCCLSSAALHVLYMLLLALTVAVVVLRVLRLAPPLYMFCSYVLSTELSYRCSLSHCLHIIDASPQTTVSYLYTCGTKYHAVSITEGSFSSECAVQLRMRKAEQDT